MCSGGAWVTNQRDSESYASGPHYQMLSHPLYCFVAVALWLSRVLSSNAPPGALHSLLLCNI